MHASQVVAAMVSLIPFVRHASNAPWLSQHAASAGAMMAAGGG
jgi:hypothetical protein